MTFFKKCDMIIKSELIFNKNSYIIKLPFYFHIKDIKNDFLDDSEGNILENYGKDIYFNDRYDEIEKDNKYFLRYVDLNQWTIEGVDNDNPLFVRKRDVFRVKDIDSLYTILIDYLKFNELDFSMIKKYCLKTQAKLAYDFREMVNADLGVASGKKDPNDIFMILRCAYELNHTSTVFSENMGCAISDYSFREMCVQRAYMARKCEIERLQYEESLKKKKS